MWHGQADQLIYPSGSIDYYRRVLQQMGGAATTAEFLRFFLAPGVGHCGGGAGPAPTGQLTAVINWVEDGKAPETLTAVRRDQIRRRRSARVHSASIRSSRVTRVRGAPTRRRTSPVARNKVPATFVGNLLRISEL